jgi:DNA-directed RNA polymerase specialized sigma subunit
MSSNDLAERDAEVVRLCVEERLTVRDVGRRFGLSEKRVRRILKGLGASPRLPSSGTSPHPSERNAEMVRLYAEGDLTLRDIGERFRVTRERVRQIVARAGVHRKAGRKVPREVPEHLKQRNDEIVRLYAEGLKLKEIANRVGLSLGGLHSVIRTANVHRRRPGTAGPRKGTPLAPADDRRKRNEDIVRLYQQERLSLRQVGARVGVSDSAVLYVLERAGVPRRSRSWRSSWPWKDAKQQRREIVHAYLEMRASTEKVATLFGISPETVAGVLEKAGMPRPGGKCVNGRRPGAAGPRKGTPLLPPNDRRKRDQEIVRLYQQERLSLRQVGARVGLSDSAVLHALQAAGVPRRSPSWRLSWPWRDAEQQRREIVDAYLEMGASIDKVATLFGISPKTVAGVLEKAGIPRARGG